ncbi:MAG TPA: HAMP domain-containing sensor histidine kinase [Actinomycetota bacterium]|jgi:two-component system sensor histidine kinase MtrB|nr:HAMP domain-containing sensor histidine kinase [Actinomycetota bacterium]
MKRRGRLRRRGLRWRITLAFLGGALAVSALVAGTTYFLAERYLLRQRIDSATQQSFTNLRSAVQYLSSGGEDVSLPGLVESLEEGGEFDVLLLRGDQPFGSFSVTREAIPAQLARVVGRGEVGYAFRENARSLIFGSPVPGHDLSVYFFYRLGDLADTLDVLRNVLLVVSGAAVVLAAAVGTRVSGRVINPVRRASDAARRVAEGLLETRLPVVGRDELGALADSFNEMAAALEERIAREQRFVGDVSHELRTPLTTLQTSTDYLLKRADQLPPSIGRATELLAADLQYLQHLVGDLLEISKAEAGKAQMVWERLNLADVAREVVARRVRGGEQLVRVEIDADLEALTTLADKQRLERVVGNLVDNALVHGKGRDVTVRVASANGFLLLSVEDLGPGIPKEALSRIFERFFKADPARQRGDGRGSGLGLAIARENAHLHGGEIDVESVGGRGARFTLRLPRRREEPQG